MKLTRELIRERRDDEGSCRFRESTLLELLDERDALRARVDFLLHDLSNARALADGDRERYETERRAFVEQADALLERAESAERAQHSLAAATIALAGGEVVAELAALTKERDALLDERDALKAELGGIGEFIAAGEKDTKYFMAERDAALAQVCALREAKTEPEGE